MRRSRASSASLGTEVSAGPARRPRDIPTQSAAVASIEVTIALSPAAADLASALLFESGATAIELSDEAGFSLRAHLPADPTLRPKLARIRGYLASLRSLGVDPGPAKVVARPFHDLGWATRWKEFFRPMRIGRRLVIKPSWDASEVGEGKIVVELDPGMAFGTGQHPTTRMCLELLEAAMEQFRVQSSEFRVRSPELSGQNLKTMNYDLRTTNRRPAVLDLGTGSGLLAIAAFRFGAREVLALDTDRVACRVASENVRRNGGGSHIGVKHGSLATAGKRTFDLVLANLTADSLSGLAARLGGSLRSGGRLIASGIMTGEERRVAASFRRSGLTAERVRRNHGWVALVCRRGLAPRHGSG